ncbi:MAG: glycerophosphodiester phosphodiesterase family protein [Dermatophilaceae bacterium]
MTRDRWFTASGPIAHRGFYDEALAAPENSLPAFARAVAHGIPFEFDVQLARDGVVVVVHDATVTLPDGATVLVRETSSDVLRRAQRGLTKEPVATLAEVLELVGGAVPLVVDVRRWGLERDDRLEQGVAGLLRDYSGPAAVQSFDPLAVWRLRRLVPGRAVGQAAGALRSRGGLVSTLGQAMLTNALTHPDFVTYELALLPSRWATFWRRRGIPVLAYPVGAERDADRARGLADNFFFGGFVPREYASSGPPPSEGERP